MKQMGPQAVLLGSRCCHLMTAGVIALSAIWCASMAAAEPADEVRRLVALAGNADGDKARLAYVKELRGLEGLDEGVRSDADKLIGHIERWLTDRTLPYFGRQVLDTEAKRDSASSA